MVKSTTIISIGNGAGKLCEYLSFISLKINMIVKDTIEMAKTAIFVDDIFLKISISVFKVWSLIFYKCFLINQWKLWIKLTPINMKGIVKGFNLMPSIPFICLTRTWKTAPVVKPLIIASDKYLTTKPRFSTEPINYIPKKNKFSIKIWIKNLFKDILLIIFPTIKK